MATPARPIAAFRQRLVGDPNLDPLSAALVAIVGERVGPSFAVDENDQPVYPCITLYQTEGKQALWAPRTFDPSVMQLQIYSKSSQQECWDCYELCTKLLHNQHTLTSSSGLCLHQIVEIFSNSGLWIPEDSVWQLTVRYRFFATVLEG
jgi:hypothetical protein